MAEEPNAQVERQLQRGGLFTHTALSQQAERLTEVESVLYGLFDVLAAKGVVEQREVGEAAAAVRDRLAADGETASPGVMLHVDAEETGAEVTPVNCAERMHICHAVCCRLRFALTADEVEAGVVRWDLGQPYQIRQDAAGTCVHNTAETGACGVYADRPGICRRYSCANDDRIWRDFEKMELNQDWIEANLTASTPRLARATMIPLEPR